MNIPVLPQLVRSFIVLSLSCAFAVGRAPWALSQQTQRAFRIPREVRAQMTADGRSLCLLRLPVKKGTPLLLMHAWVVDKPVRGSSGDGDGAEDNVRFHLDFFVCRNSKWQLRLPVSYLSESPVAPFDSDGWGSYEWRYLDSKHKEGIVVVEKLYLGSSSSIRLLTLPHGVLLSSRVSLGAYQIQDFSQINFGGQSASNITFGTEADGKLVVVDDYGSVGGRQKSIYAWRNGQWKPIRQYSNRYKVEAEMRAAHQRWLKRQDQASANETAPTPSP